MTEPFKSYTNVLESRRHLLEMLEDRGYNVEHLKNFTPDDIKEIMLNHITGKFTTIPEIGPLDIFVEKNIGMSNAETVYVKYRLDMKFKGTASLVTQINDIYDKILTPKDTLIILNVQRVLMKIGVKDKVDEQFVNDFYIRKNYFVQIFGLENFKFNVSRHQFVPKHTILSKEEEDEVLQKYNLTKNKLPKILKSDPVARYYGMKNDQICKILRKSPEVGEAIYYRLVK